MKISADVLTVLKDCYAKGSNLYLPSHMHRAMYVSVNIVLEAAGGKWNRKEKAHKFDAEAQPILEGLYSTGEIIVPQDFGYYPSPPAVVNRLIELAELHSRHVVLEPSAGRGAIASRVSELCAAVHCIELLPDNVKALTEMNDTGKLGKNATIIEGDFLSAKPSPQGSKYDRIVMNPPFEKQNDILHVQHALAFLKPIGLLVSVMSASVLFRDNKLTSNFRKLVEERGGAFEDLPENSFKVSGTNVRTVIVTINGSK